ncbi:MAG TPA: hypothetical protein VIW29_03555, partial [Polyangiaceae bacterium]
MTGLMRTFRPLLLLVAGWLGNLASCGTAATVVDGPIESSCPELVEDPRTTVPEPPDGAAECASGVCNYQTQAGCSASEACRPQFSASSATVEPGCEAAGGGESGAACTEQVDCARGFFCDPLGSCRKLCCGGDWTGCDAGESCIRNLQVKAGGKVVSAGADLCFPVGTCDLFDPESCSDEPGRECKVVDPTGAIACSPLSTKDVGESCGPPTVCKRGLACVGGSCVKLCAFEECGEPS